MSATRTRLIRHEFPELADGCSITIRNPRWAPAARLSPDRAAKTDADGNADKADAALVGAQWLLWFVQGWDNMPPVIGDDQWDSEDDWQPETLGPPSVETMQQLPAEVEMWLVTQVLGAARPS